MFASLVLVLLACGCYGQPGKKAYEDASSPDSESGGPGLGTVLRELVVHPVILSKIFNFLNQPNERRVLLDGIYYIGNGQLPVADAGTGRSSMKKQRVPRSISDPLTDSAESVFDPTDDDLDEATVSDEDSTDASEDPSTAEYGADFNAAVNAVEDPTVHPGMLKSPHSGEPHERVLIDRSGLLPDYKNHVDDFLPDTAENELDPLMFIERSGLLPEEVSEEVKCADTPQYYGAVKGVPGVHFPGHYDIPSTPFSCADKQIPGFYADLETGCQVFHVCWPHKRESFLCPVGTTFNQALLACDYWYNTDCSLAPLFYDGTDIKDNSTVSSMIGLIIGNTTPRTKEAVANLQQKEGPSADLPVLAEDDLKQIMQFFPIKVKVAEYPEDVHQTSEEYPNQSRMESPSAGRQDVPSIEKSMLEVMEYLAKDIQNRIEDLKHGKNSGSGLKQLFQAPTQGYRDHYPNTGRQEGPIPIFKLASSSVGKESGNQPSGMEENIVPPSAEDRPMLPNESLFAKQADKHTPYEMTNELKEKGVELLTVVADALRNVPPQIS